MPRDRAVARRARPLDDDVAGVEADGDRAAELLGEAGGDVEAEAEVVAAAGGIAAPEGLGEVADVVGSERVVGDVADREVEAGVRAMPRDADRRVGARV